MTAAVSRLAILEPWGCGWEAEAGTERLDEEEAFGVDDERWWKGRRVESVRERWRGDAWVWGFVDDDEDEDEFEVDVVEEDFVDDEQDALEFEVGAVPLLGRLGSGMLISVYSGSSYFSRRL